MNNIQFLQHQNLYMLVGQIDNRPWGGRVATITPEWIPSATAFGYEVSVSGCGSYTMAITFEQEVVKPLPRHKDNWTFVPSDEVLAYLNKCPMATVTTEYNGIDATIDRHRGLYRLKMAGRTFMLNKCELRQFTMAR